MLPKIFIQHRATLFVEWCCRMLPDVFIQHRATWLDDILASFEQAFEDYLNIILTCSRININPDDNGNNVPESRNGRKPVGNNLDDSLVMRTIEECKEEEESMFSGKRGYFFALRPVYTGDFSAILGEIFLLWMMWSEGVDYLSKLLWGFVTWNIYNWSTPSRRWKGENRSKNRRCKQAISFFLHRASNPSCSGSHTQNSDSLPGSCLGGQTTCAWQS